MEKLEKITCPECNGNGRDLLSKDEACQLCDGRREIFTGVVVEKTRPTFNINVKKLRPDAKLPIYGSDGAACFDLHAIVDNEDGIILQSPQLGSHPFEYVFSTGLSFDIPDGYQMLIFSRSGHGFNQNVRLANCVGVIDSDYLGEVKVKLIVDDYGRGLRVRNGDRIAQAQILPVLRTEFVEVDELNKNTERGDGGFGSTGN